VQQRNRSARIAVLGSPAPRSRPAGLSSRSATAVKRRVVAGVLILLSLVLITIYFREPAGGGLHSVQSAGATVLRPFEVASERVARPFRDAYGWFAGLILLWSSRAWTTRDKWIGTLVVPGGLATSVFIGLLAIGVPSKKFCRVIAGGVQHCTNAGGPGTASNILGVAVFAFLVLAPIATSVYLARRAA